MRLGANRMQAEKVLLSTFGARAVLGANRMQAEKVLLSTFGACLEKERGLFEVNSQVDILDVDFRHLRQPRRGEVQDSPDAGFHKRLVAVGGRSRRDRQDSEVGA